MVRNDLFNKVSGYNTTTGATTAQTLLPSGTIASQNALDLLARKDIAPGTKLCLNLTVATTFVGDIENSNTHATAGTLNFTAASNRVTWTGHGMADGARIQFVEDGTGSLPTGGSNLAFDTDYYVIVVDANTFELASTKAIALGGTLDITWTADDESGDFYCLQLSQMTIEVVTASDLALTSDVVVLGQANGGDPYEVSELTAGRDPITVEINQQFGSIGQRYLGVRYIKDAVCSAGAVHAYFSLNVDSGRGAKPYPSGWTVQT